MNLSVKWQNSARMVPKRTKRVMDSNMKLRHEMSCLTFPRANIRSEKAKLGLIAFDEKRVLDKLGVTHFGRARQTIRRDIS